MGGMFGVRNGAMKPFKKAFEKGIQDSEWNCDQEFLNKNIYPGIKDKAVIHDEYKTHFTEPESKKFPVEKEENQEHVGEVNCESYRRASAIIGELKDKSDRTRL